MLSSKSNALIKLINSLKDKKNRDESGLFLIEGNKFIADALKNSFQAKYLICTPKNADEFNSSIEVTIVTDELFSYISGIKSPQGVMGIFEIPQRTMNDVLACDKILFLENVQNSENVGALIRSAVCAGYKAVILSKTTADCYSEKAVRASAGSIFNITIYRSDLSCIKLLKSHGYKIVGSHLRGDEQAQLMFDKLVLIIGNEGAGMSESLAADCDILARIPIYGDCESLNAVNAGTLLMYKTVGY